MALAEGQVAIRDFIMGAGTDLVMLDDFNPFDLEARADQGGPRAWGHGNWSGVEWRTEIVVPLRLYVGDRVTRTPARCRELLSQLRAAFRPVGEETGDVELTWRCDGREYTMFGRPRRVNPDPQSIRRGFTFTECAFVALDPFIYGPIQAISSIGLPTFTGGLTVPFTAPLTVTGTPAAGFTTITNEGTRDNGLLLRLNGPLVEPSVVLERADGSYQRLDFDLELSVNQWLDIDTKNRLVLLNGASSQRGAVSGNWIIVPPGTHTLRWNSTAYNDTATLSGSFRSAWY